MEPLRERLRQLYLGRDRTAARFQRGLLAVDILVLGYFLITALLPAHPTYRGIDLILAGLLALDAGARIAIAPRPLVQLVRLSSLLDIVIVASLVLPALGGNLGFLRVLRTLRILRSYHVLGELRRRSAWVRQNEEPLRAAVNLAAFVFFVSAFVYATQVELNPGIESYIDALYFTVTTLTTTGFGDITLHGEHGRLTAIVIMIAGISLFLRLVQTLFRPGKVRFACPRCGLQRHEVDAVHCKACGEVLNIPNEDS